MSWQSVALNLMFRFQKRSMKKYNFQQARDSMNKSMSRAEKTCTLPDDASSTVESLNNVRCEWVVAASASNSGRVVTYFHGGAFMVGSPATHRDMAWRLSEASGMKVLLVDYRLTPEHVYPAQLDDAINVYQWLLNNGYTAQDIAFAGDSAGGNMTLTTMLKARELSLPLPAAGACLSPWLDLTHSGESIKGNENADPMLAVNILVNAAEVYGRGADLSDPLISPVFADISGFPPLLVYVGSTEILLSDAQLIVKKAKEAGVDVEYQSWHKQAHAFPVMAQFLPEGRQAVNQVGQFLKAKLDAISTEGVV